MRVLVSGYSRSSAPDDRGDVAACLFECHTRREPRHRAKVVRPAKANEPGLVVSEWAPVIRIGAGKRKRGRHHANHLDRVAVEFEATADDRRIAAEPPLPEAVVDHDHTVRSRPRLVGRERAAVERRHAESGEEVVRNRHAADALRVAGASQRHVVQARPLGVAAEIEGNAAERAIAAANVDQVCRGQRVVRPVPQRVRLPDLHQPGWFVKRQRLEQHGAHDAEHRSVGADADRQHGDGEDREARPVRQAAHRVADVLGNHGKTPFFLAQPERMNERAERAPDQISAGRQPQPLRARHLGVVVAQLGIPLAKPVGAHRRRHDGGANGEQEPGEGRHR